MRRWLSHLLEDLVDHQQNPFTLGLSSDLISLQHSLDLKAICVVLHDLKLSQLFHSVLNL